MIIPFIFLGLLILFCIVLMRKINTQENHIFDLKDKLEISDREYILLFNINIELSEELENPKKTKKKKGWYDEENDNRMNVIGQNGNEGTHYEQQKK
jgi:hypothetical protein